MNVHNVWKNVFAANTEKGLDEHFETLATEFFTLYQALNNNESILFSLTQNQKDVFHQYFTQAQTKYITLKGLDYMGTIRRSGLIMFRVTMVFSILRILETGDFSKERVCELDDFNNGLKIIDTLVAHASKVYNDLPEEPLIEKSKNRKERFLDALPATFTRLDYVAIAEKLKIADKTAQAYITDFVKAGIIKRDEQNNYTNPAKAFKP